jgi:tetratricopeptide (TPR) repeat protein
VLDAANKYVEKKKYDKAIAELRTIVEADPRDARTLHKIGELQAKQGLYAEAIDTFETVGKMFAVDGFAQKAVAVYRQIREMIALHLPQHAVRYGHITPKLAELYREMGLNKEALALLEELAISLEKQGKDGEAIETFRQITSIDPTNPLPHLRLAEALSRARNVEGAVESFKIAADLLVKLERQNDALMVLERLLQHKVDVEQARICAEIYLARARPQDGMQALSRLQICYQANPRDIRILQLIARAFEMVGERQKAQNIQQEIARLSRGAS